MHTCIGKLRRWSTDSVDILAAFDKVQRSTFKRSNVQTLIQAKLQAQINGSIGICYHVI
jgi:hypothetical protein